MGSCLGRFRWNRPGMAWTCELLACCCLLLHSAGAAPQQEFPSQFQQGLPRHIRQFASQQTSSAAGQQSAGASSLALSLLQGQRVSPQQQPYYSQPVSPPAPVTPRLQPTTTTTVRPTSTARQVDVNAEYAALLEAHRLSNLEHQRRQLELLEEQKQVIEEQKKAQLEQLQRQQENSIQVEKLAKAEAETPKATTKPRRTRLRITSTSTQQPVVFSTTSTAEPATRPSTTLAPTSTTSTTSTSTTTTSTTTTTPPIIVPQAVHSAVSTLSAYLNPSSGEGAQLLEAPDHIWIALKELALFLKRSQLPV